MPVPLELGTQVHEVIDLAVVGAHEALVRGRHGLVSKSRQVDHRQPAISKSHAGGGVHVGARVVGAAMAKRVRHRFQSGHGCSAVDRRALPRSRLPRTWFQYVLSRAL